MTKSYEDIHGALSAERGRAALYVCECGEPAKDWAYQFNGSPELYAENGRPYAEDLFSCYAPMCRKCHAQLDVSKDARLKAIRVEHGLKAGALIRERLLSDPEFAAAARERGYTQVEYLAGLRETDPEFAEKMKTVGQKLGAYQAELYRNDPEYSARVKPILQQNMSKALQFTRERMSDPEFAAKVSSDRAKAASVANRKRRKCLDCGRESSPAGMGMHLKGSGHKGYVNL